MCKHIPIFFLIYLFELLCLLNSVKKKIQLKYKGNYYSHLAPPNYKKWMTYGDVIRQDLTKQWLLPIKLLMRDFYLNFFSGTIMFFNNKESVKTH